MANLVLNGSDITNVTPNQNIENKSEDVLDKNMCRILEDTEIHKEIVLDELTLGETTIESSDGEKKAQSNIAGLEYPIIKINDYTFAPDEILNFTMYNEDKIPSVSLSVSLTGNVFTSKNMPTDGTIVSIGMRISTDTIKPIKHDYIIKSVNEAKGQTNRIITITADLHIPYLEQELTFGIIGSSKDAFMDIAKRIGIGFAFNDHDDTNDKQLWVCHNETCYNFMNDIISHSWKDGMSFYDWWVDLFFNINFINVNKMLLENAEKMDITANSTTVLGGYETKYDVSQENTKATLKVFTNIPQYSDGSPFFIRKWKVINNSSNITSLYGTEIVSQTFMHNQNLYANGIENFVNLSNVPAYDPKKVDNHILLRGRPKYSKENNPEKEQARANYDYKNIFIKQPWCGIQYVMSSDDEKSLDTTDTWSGNVSANYTRAEYHNEINLAELEKMYIEIEVDGLCAQVKRGEVVPVALRQNATDLPINATTNKEQPLAEKFYNGHYYVKGIVYKYIKGQPSKFKTILTLTRREWPIPVDAIDPSTKK